MNKNLVDFILLGASLIVGSGMGWGIAQMTFPERAVARFAGLLGGTFALVGLVAADGGSRLRILAVAGAGLQ